MSEQSKTVALCAFTDMEERLFEGIFRVSATRDQPYQRWNDGSDQPPDIYMVKQGKAAALEQWQEWSERFANRDAAILEIGTGETEGWTALSEQAGREIPYLLKPVSAKRLLDTLDRLPGTAPQPASGVLISDDVSLEQLSEFDRQAARGAQDVIGQGKSVLVVDDSASLRLQMDINLGKKHGMRVDFAADGANALRKLENRSYDMVFLDVMLPDMDGFEICKRIRRQFHSKVPVVMLTSRDGRRDQLKGVLVQADDYLIKPLAAEKLEETLAKHLGDAPQA